MKSVVHYYLVRNRQEKNRNNYSTVQIGWKKIHEDTMEVTVGTDDQIVPIKDYGFGQSNQF